MNRARAGFTLVEMLIALAVAALLIALAAPSFREYILMQRLKGINAQLVTDLAYARSEAASRGVNVHVKVIDDNNQASCYIIYTHDASVSNAQGFRFCDCNKPAGSRCPAGTFQEIKTVQVPRDLQVRVAPFSPAFSSNNCVPSGSPAPTSCSRMYFDPRNGGMTATTVDGTPLTLQRFEIDTYIDASRKFRDQVGLSGRTTVCIPTGSKLSGTAC